jgi:uncharacterized protein involved in outer membrane biogenesis
MRRILWIAGAGALSILAFFALVVALLPREELKARLGEQIAAWTGRDVSLSGEPELDFLPILTVTLNDVQVGGPEDMTDATIVSMDRLVGTIRLVPLIIGRIEIDSFTMVHPLIRLVRDEAGSRNWAFDAGAAALQLAFAGDVPLGDFELQDGTVIYEDRGLKETERLDSVNLSVNWSSVRQPLAVTGSGVWRGEQVSFAGTAGTPFTFMNGGASRVEARLDSAPIVMIFDGQADEYPSPRLNGGLKLTTPSLRRFVSWLGSPIEPGSTLGPASLFGTANFQERILSVDSAELTLDGNNASGALKVAATKTPDVTGTLAFASLDLTPYFLGLATAVRTADDWREIRFDTNWFADLSADIRLSAASVRLGELISGDTAATVSLRNSRLEIGVARAAFDGGSLTGGLAVVDHAERPGASFEAQLRAVEFDVERVATLFEPPQPASGIASAAVDVAAEGRDPVELTRSLGGTAQLDLRDGSVPLFGLGEMADSIGEDSRQFATDGLATTPVTALKAGFSFAGGIAVLEYADIVAPGYTADASGWIGLLDGTLGLSGTLRQGSVATDVAAEEQGMPFTIEGTLRRPAANPLTLVNEPQ